LTIKFIITIIETDMTDRYKYKQLTTGNRQSSATNPTLVTPIIVNMLGWQTSVRRKKLNNITLGG